MADNTIDSLEIQISAAAGKAINELDRLTGSLTGLKNALKFDNANQMKTGFDGVTKSAGKTATTLKSLSKDFLSSFGKISKSGLEEAEQALYVLNEQMKAGIDISSKAKKSLSSLSDEFVSFEQLSFDTDGLSELNDLSKLAKDTLRRLAEEALTTGASFRTMDNEIADFIHSYSKGTAKIKIPVGVKEDIGDDFKSIRAKLGKAFTSKDVDGTPLDAVIKEIDSAFGTKYGDLPISDAFRELGEVIDRARNSEEKYREEIRNDTATQNAISQAIEETIGRFSELEGIAQKTKQTLDETIKQPTTKDTSPLPFNATEINQYFDNATGKAKELQSVFKSLDFDLKAKDALKQVSSAVIEVSKNLTLLKNEQARGVFSGAFEKDSAEWQRYQQVIDVVENRLSSIKQTFNDVYAASNSQSSGLSSIAKEGRRASVVLEEISKSAATASKIKLDPKTNPKNLDSDEFFAFPL